MIKKKHDINIGALNLVDRWLGPFTCRLVVGILEVIGPITWTSKHIGHLLFGDDLKYLLHFVDRKFDLLAPNMGGNRRVEPWPHVIFVVKYGPGSRNELLHTFFNKRQFVHKVFARLETVTVKPPSL